MMNQWMHAIDFVIEYVMNDKNGVEVTYAYDYSEGMYFATNENIDMWIEVEYKEVEKAVGVEAMKQLDELVKNILG